MFNPNIFKNNKLNLKIYSKEKEYRILDFGCGEGVWNKANINKNYVIYLFDKNKKILNFVKKKYNRFENIHIINNINLRKLFVFIKKKKINTVIFNSVIQYISEKDLKYILLNIKNSISNKKFLIIISDIPVYSRFYELLLYLFFDLKRLRDAMKLIININYYKINFFKDNYNIQFLKDNFAVKIIDNIMTFKFRRTILLKNKFI
jgi:hypothetical protein